MAVNVVHDVADVDGVSVRWATPPNAVYGALWLTHRRLRRPD